jgi:hypothetical protein
MNLSDITGPRHLRERFWWYVDKASDLDGCWFWKAAASHNGYGRYNVVHKGRPQLIAAHRLSWILTHGSLADDALVLHKCDVKCVPGDVSYRACVRPDHLFVGTAADNVQDAISKGRFRTRAPRKRARKEGRLRLVDAVSVASMRTRFASGEQICRLARAYGISQSYAAAIIYGRCCKDLPGACARPTQRQTARGARASQAKLSEEQVLSIRQKFRDGVRKSELARAYGLSPSHIREIVHGTIWVDLPGAVPRSP